MSDIQVSPSTAEELGLLPEEFERIKEILGRSPNFTELSVFSVMWSEQAALRITSLPRKSQHNSEEKRLAREEAGVGLIDLGNGYELVFKMEARNHLSTSGPSQGLETGVGGFHKGIISRGSRPIAALNSLRFGDIELPDTQDLLKGVIKGIGACGDALGVPMVGGDLYFDTCYNTNPLVNTLSVGIVKKGQASNAVATGAGNPVFIVGAATGKESLFGVPYAPTEKKEELSSVQLLNPDTEKRLLEATLEALKTGAIVGVQDMGVAGISFATAEMAARGKVGMEIWLDKVPLQQENLLPVEILLSDSPERMLFVLENGREQPILETCAKWGLNCTQIGEINDSGNLRYLMNEELVGEIPAEVLVSGASALEREQKEPAYFEEVRTFDPDSIIEPIEHDRVIRHLLVQLSIASKEWVVEQYQAKGEIDDKASPIPSDAAVVRMQGLKTGIVLSSDCNARYVHADPEKGAMLAVAEAARNIACVGGTPLGVSNCLNFGNPNDPEVYFQFAQANKGLEAACQKFDTPATGGNVSFYNQTDSKPIFPTPVIGMLGLMDDAENDQMSMDFKAKGDQIYLLGKVLEDFGSSEYIYSYHRRPLSPAPYVNLDEELSLQKILLKLIREKAISSAHDISDGGLIISVLESAFSRELGFHLKCPEGIRKDAFLYGESGGRAIVSVSTSQLSRFIRLVHAAKVEALHLGTLTGEFMVIDGEKMGAIREYKRLYNRALHKKLGL